jgi:hypothetical protein
MLKIDERLNQVFSLVVESRNVLEKMFDVLSDYDFAICGGVAVAYWVTGREPTSREIDILVRKEEVDDVIHALREAGCRVGRKGTLEVYSVPVNCDGFHLDLVVAHKSWEKEALDSAVGAGDFRVVRPEYLIVMKLYGGREKDMQDVVLLLDRADEVKVKRLVQRHLGKDWVEDLEDLIEIARSVGSEFSKGRLSEIGVIED